MDFTRAFRVSVSVLLLAFLTFGYFPPTSASISGTDSGLVAYYAMDENAGNTAADSSGSGYTGNLVNGPVWSAGKFGNALSFDNQNDYVSVPFDAAGTEGNAITVSAWVKPSTISDSGGVIVAKDRSGFPQWKLRIDGRSGNNLKNNLIFSVGASGTMVSANSDNEVMADLGWHHVVGIYDGSQVYVYMDAASLDSSPNYLSGTINNYQHNICIGTSGTTCNETNYFGGLIDDVRIYNRALTASEISDLYNFGSTPPAPDTTAPAVSVTSPLAGDTVSGTVAITATASDDTGVAGVQFTLDGANFGTEDTTAPYSVSWNTQSSSNGSYVLGAQARDAAGNTALAASVSVNVNNIADTNPPVISGVSSTVTPSSATITWNTDEAADGQVEYGLTSAYGSVSALNASLTTAHSQTISGLSASTVYHYRVLSKDASGNLAASSDFMFTTQAQPAVGAPNMYYPLDETSGTVAFDQSGNNYNGNLVNGPAWTTGKIGNALSFDNANDYVSIPYDTAAAEGSAITVAAWVKPSTISDAGGVIVAKDRSGFTQWKLRIDGRSGNNAKNNLMFTVGSVTATSDSEVMADLGWHHVAGVYDGSQVYIYMDGVSVDSTANPMTAGIPNYPHNICIGTSGTTCNESNFFGGLIDDVRIYDHALTQSEIQQLMSSASDTSPKVSVTASDPLAAEAGNGTATFSISRTGQTTSPLDVKYSVSGTATSGADYQPLSGTMNIPAGSTIGTVVLTPIDDMEIEQTETVTLTLSPDPAYGFVDPTSATASIADNDVLANSIIIDHSAVDLYDKIPQAYIDQVKTMWLDVPGESDSRAYVNGVRYLAQQNPAFPAVVTESGTPAGPRTDALRVSNSSWGDINDTTGWMYWYGEQDWYTSDQAKQRTKDGIQYMNNLGNPASAFGFGWCIDMCRNTFGYSEIDPVYSVRWSGSSVGGPEGDRPWGLDAEDTALTGNSINLDTYLNATQEYQDYASANSIPTKVFLSTGPLRDACSGINAPGELSYQTNLKNDRIRQYAMTHQGSVLFDFADIMAYNDAGQLSQKSWTNYAGNTVTFQSLHPDNMLNFDGSTNTDASDSDGDHIGQKGSLRIGKAAWVLMARLAGWDGQSTN